MIYHKYYTVTHHCQQHHCVVTYDVHYDRQLSRTSNDNIDTEMPMILIHKDNHVDQYADKYVFCKEKKNELIISFARDEQCYSQNVYLNDDRRSKISSQNGHFCVSNVILLCIFCICL